MYERFTDRARKVMQLADQEAKRFRHEYIGTEHILLGLIAEGSGVAANVLKNLDIDLRKIRLEVEKIVQHGGADEVIMGRLPHTPRVKKIIEYAIEEARTLNHNYVGTEHLLLGVLREQEGVAAQVLANFGLKLEDVREEVLNLLGHNMPQDVAPVIASVAPAASAVDPDVTKPGTGSGIPPNLTPDQLNIVKERIRLLNEQKDVFIAAQDFALAARCRDEAHALARLLVWYDWARRPR